jgi:hypothetical protein
LSAAERHSGRRAQAVATARLKHFELKLIYNQIPDGEVFGQTDFHGENIDIRNRRSQNKHCACEELIQFESVWLRSSFALPLHAV